MKHVYVYEAYYCLFMYCTVYTTVSDSVRDLFILLFTHDVKVCILSQGSRREQPIYSTVSR